MDEFRKFIYQDMINEWNKMRISYIIDNKHVNQLKQNNPSITHEMIMKEFQKIPLVREVIMDNGKILIFPK
jgi:hypothetical protein